jgi:hypothetical protein
VQKYSQQPLIACGQIVLKISGNHLWQANLLLAKDGPVRAHLLIVGAVNSESHGAIATGVDVPAKPTGMP